MQLEKHPLNDGFDWQDRQGPFRRITDAQAKQYNEQGFFVLEDAFSADEMAAVQAALDPLEQQTEAFLRTQQDGKLFIAQADQITFTINCVLHSDVLQRFTKHQVFADLCHDLMGPDCRLYWDQAVYKKPEPEREFPWHQDNGYTFIRPQQYLTCWVALTDATEDNGCPWVVPGVHRDGTFNHWMTETGWRCVDDDDGTALCAPVKAGGIVVFSSLTPHRTGPNVTDGVRKSYIVQYAPDGASLVEPDGKLVACDDPARQYYVVKDGAPVAV